MTLSIVRCRVLGGAEIHTRGIRLTPESDLQFGLGLFFCAQPGRDVPRDEILRLFWPRHRSEAARHCLRQALYRLRILGIPVRTGARSNVLEPHFVEADFLPAVADGAPPGIYLRLADVTVLPAYAPGFSRPFARWVEEFRADVGSRLRRGLVRGISELRARGRYGDVERLCRFCLQLDPLNEEATLALAESVALAGGKVEAVGLIDRYEGEVGRYRPDLRVSASLLRERVSDRLVRRHQAAIELPMIGREADVERVLTAFQRLKGNRAVSYVVTGSAGVGKTRLAYECCRMAELQGARILTVGTQPSSRTQALYAVSELVDGLLRMPGAIGCAPAALECLRAMSSPAPMRDAGYALDADGESRFAMVRWSILDVMDAILSEGPLVIHVDDAHQMDEHSQAILHDALRTHAGRPLLLLFTMRQPEPGDAERFTRLHGVSTVHELLPLSDESCDRLVHRFCAMHEETLDEAARERIIQLSGGNPFFLVELLKLRSELVTDELPVTVQALLEDRLSRLSPGALTVLRAAAVLGLSSNVERLHRMVERRTSDVLAALSELQAAGMLTSAEAGTVCRHDTIREAVLERTPTAARALLHRRAAKTLGREALRDGGVALLWEVVHHWSCASARREGLRTSLLLGQRLLRLGLAREAMPVFTQVEGHSQEQPERARALAGQAHASRLLRDWPTVETAVSRWRAIYSQEGRLPPQHNELELVSFEAHYNGRHTHGSLPPRIAECFSSPRATVRHRLAAATIAMIQADNNGDEEAATRVYNATASLLPRTTTENIDALTSRAVFHAAFGDLSLVPGLLQDLAIEAMSLRNPALRAHHMRRASFGLMRYADEAQAKRLLETALDLFERLGLQTQAALCIEDLGTLALWQGELDQARSWIGRVRTIQSSSDDPLCGAVEFELRVLLAAESGDATLLPDFEFPAAIRDSYSGSTRGRQSLLALDVLAATVAGERASLRDRVDDLLRLHELMGRKGYQDPVVAAVVSGLLALDRSEEAGRLVTRYLECDRRELKAPRALLKAAAARALPTNGDGNGAIGVQRSGPR
ncbi:MAG: AAA family ATPase [Gemmatimonadaceae bacterium]|nr:AAA family ATPase [Gemmatimonadaceae bacterium]